MRELAVQAASGQYDDVNRSALHAEFTQLYSEIDRAIDATNFNGKKLLTGEFTKTEGVNFQVGATTTKESQINLKIDNFKTALSATVPTVADSALTDPKITGNAAGTYEGVALKSANITDVSNALASIESVDNLLKKVNSARADLGAVQARFEGVLTQLSAAHENTEAARSRIMDADYASETASLARAQILQQAGVAMLAQANAIPQNVLSLLQ
jgi:flagellin